MKVRTPVRWLAVGSAIAALALGGCRARDNDPGPGGVTVGEARALDDAAKMLENRPHAPPVAPGSGGAAVQVQPRPISTATAKP